MMVILIKKMVMVVTVLMVVMVVTVVMVMMAVTVVMVMIAILVVMTCIRSGHWRRALMSHSSVLRDWTYYCNFDHII